MASTSLGPGAGSPEKSPAIDYVARARALAPVIAAQADEIERRRELPESLRDKLIDGGFFRLLLPRSLGGAELPPLSFVPVIEEIAKSDASTAWCLNQISGCSMTAAYLAPAAAREVFGGPHGILAWGPGPGEARVVESRQGSALPAAAMTRTGSAPICRLSSTAASRACVPTEPRSSTPCCSRNRSPK